MKDSKDYLYHCLCLLLYILLLSLFVSFFLVLFLSCSHSLVLSPSLSNIFFPHCLSPSRALVFLCLSSYVLSSSLSLTL